MKTKTVRVDELSRKARCGDMAIVEHEACTDNHASTRRAIVLAAAEIGRKGNE